MTIEGKVVSIGLHRDKIKYAVVAVADARYQSCQDFFHILNNYGLEPGDRVSLKITKCETNLMDAPNSFDESDLRNSPHAEDEHVGQRGWGQE